MISTSKPHRSLLSGALYNISELENAGRTLGIITIAYCVQQMMNVGINPNP